MNNFEDIGNTLDLFEQSLPALLNPSFEDIIYAKTLLIKVRTHLLSVKLLYENSIWTDSIILLQQACEKTAKAYGLINGFFTKKEMYQIRHTTPLFIKFILDKYNLEKQDYFLVKSLQVTKEEVVFFLEILEGIKKNNQKDLLKDLAFKSNEIIRENILFLDQWRENWVNALGKNTVGDYLKLGLIPPELLKNISEEEIGELKKNKYTLKDLLDIESFSFKLYDPFLLFIFGFLTTPHAIAARYDDEKIITEKDYTSELGIVKSIPLILKILDQIINRIENEEILKIVR